MQKIFKRGLQTFASIILTATIAQAGSDPACSGGDQNVCDTLGTMINMKGKGCHRMMSVSPKGSNGYLITCVVSSSSTVRTTYTLQFSADQTSYTLN